jgi:hypothetical protein
VTIPSLSEFFAELLARETGPLKLRFLLQPVTSIFFAVRSEIRDAREGRTPYFTGLLADATRRRQIIQEGRRDVGRVFLFCLVVDLAYQVVVLHAFRPLEAAVVGSVLAIVPYLLIRALLSRILRRRGPEGYKAIPE